MTEAPDAQVVPLLPQRGGRTLPFGAVTFVFADVEGSTGLLQSLGPDYPARLAGVLGLLAAAFGEHGAFVDDAGDGLFYAFADAGDAVRAAWKAQRDVIAGEAGREPAFRVRIGVHTGTAHPVGGRYVALAVHEASRVCTAASGAQVLVSAATAAAAGRLDEVELRRLGRFRLRGVEQPVVLHQLLADGLPRTVQEPRAARAAVRGVAVPRSAFVGRAAERTAVQRLLTPGSVVTLVGPAGVGKTRLAVEAATAAAQQSWDGGAWFIDLAELPASAPEQVVTETVVRAVLGPGVAGTATVEALAGRFDAAPGLLVIDNAEHVLRPVAAVVDALLTETPDVGVLVTSRKPLRLDGELVVRLAPLAARDGDEDGVSDAAALVLERLRASDALAAERVSHDDLEELCRRLDGLPLALELAAARIASLGLPAVLAALDDGLGPIEDSGTTRSLDAAVRWSWDLLTAEQQTLWARLSVFARTFSVASATAVCSDDLLPPVQLPALLAALVDASVVARTEAGRFVLHVAMREFGRRQLEAAGELARFGDRHGAWAESVAETEWWQRDDDGGDAPGCHWDHPELTAALAALTAETAPERWLRLATGLLTANSEWGHHVESERIAKDMISRDWPPSAAAAYALGEASFFSFGYEADTCWVASDQSMAMLDRVAELDTQTRRVVLFRRGCLLIERDPASVQAGKELLEALYAEVAADNDEWMRARVATALTALRRDDGDMDEARRLMVDAAAVGRRRGHVRLEAISLLYEGMALHLDDPTQAADRYARAADLAWPARLAIQALRGDLWLAALPIEHQEWVERSRRAVGWLAANYLEPDPEFHLLLAFLADRLGLREVASRLLASDRALRAMMGNVRAWDERLFATVAARTPPADKREVVDTRTIYPELLDALAGAQH